MIYRLAKKKNLKAEINVVPYIDAGFVDYFYGFVTFVDSRCGG